jgi:hypothetical protein
MRMSCLIILLQAFHFITKTHEFRWRGSPVIGILVMPYLVIDYGDERNYAHHGDSYTAESSSQYHQFQRAKTKHAES